MQQFDPASVAALLATLTARAEGQQFALTTATPVPPSYDVRVTDVLVRKAYGTLLSTDHPVQPQVAPTSQSRSLVTWKATYRSPTYQLPVLGQGGAQGRVVGYDVFPGISRTFGPEGVVCDTASVTLAQGLLLLWAQTQFDLHDQRSKQAGRAPAKVP